MQSFPINWWAILVAVIAKQALGALWYSPVVFGPAWCELAGVSEQEMKAGLVKALIPDVVAAFVMAFVLVHAVHYAGAQSLGQGAAVGFFNWLGFILVVQLDDWAAAKRPLGFLAINAGANLVSLLIMGAILGATF